MCGFGEGGNAAVSEDELFNDEYEFMVRQCAENDLPIDLRNRHIDHAVILTEYILKCARDYVSIFSGCFHEAFSTRVLDVLRTALQRGVKITIAVTERDAVPEKIMELAGDFSNLNLNRSSNENVDYMRKRGHFCVSDHRRYRMERPHPYDQDFSVNKAVSAVANFNSGNYARELDGIFTDLLGRCERIAVS